ncbi:TM0106 family RecB-like putative nuclease [Anaerolineae bacterium CFX9]|nr:TM0106 family RecB-like putative nuclease [Anaerolineae bacterium CFX9]
MTSSLSLSLLNGLTQHTRNHMQRMGITSLEQIAALTETELCAFNGIGKVKASAIRAQAQAYLEARPVWLAAPPAVCQGSGWFFDIETDPTTQSVWSIGWSGMDGDIEIILVDPALPRAREQRGRLLMVDSAAEAWRAFADAMTADPHQGPIFHWSPYDSGNMRQTAPPHVTAALLPRLNDLCHLFRKTVTIPARGVSIKTVARYFGFDWSEYADWFAAFNDYRHWLRSRDDEALIRACAYQGDDVRAMVIVHRWLQNGSGGGGG